MQITMDIVEVEGRSFEGVKILGVIPQALEADEFNVYVRWHSDGRVTADRSDTDAVLVSTYTAHLGKRGAFTDLMVRLASMYGVPVVVACDFGVSGGQSAKMVGTYEPREGSTPAVTPTPVPTVEIPPMTPVMYTADGVEIIGGLAVWDYNLDAGTVDLGGPGPDGWFHVRLFKGGKSLMNAERVRVAHPYTGENAAGGNLMATDPTPVAETGEPCAYDLVTPGEIETAIQTVRRNGRVFTAEASNFAPDQAFIRAMEAGRLTVIYDGDMSRYVLPGGEPVGSHVIAPNVMLAMPAVVTDRDMRDQVVAYLADDVDGFYVDGIIDHLIKVNNGAISIDDVSTDVWLCTLATFQRPTEAQVWAGTGTVLIKAPIRTKLAKRARKSTRRARRGIKGGM